VNDPKLARRARRFTDPSGETGVWNPTLFGWQDEDGSFKDSTFGLPGMDRSPEELDAVIFQLVQLADRTESPDIANALRQRAKQLWEDSHDPASSPYPFQ
jgi:hypothetical protein